VFDRVIFFNHFHNGDIHVSREYVKYIMRHVPAKGYIYSHNNPKKLLLDIDNLEHDPTLLDSLNMEVRYTRDDKANMLYINTWYRNSDLFDKLGCTLNTLHYLFDSLMRELFNEVLSNDITKFIPEINFDKFEILNINKFIKDNKDNKKVLISNNDVQSLQSSNFDFNPIIDNLSSQYPNILFLVSNKMHHPLNKSNVVYTGDIIGVDGNDLNEIAYISTFCDIIVGRASAAYTFSHVKENLMSKNKKFLCFCYVQDIAYWVHPVELIKAKIIWKDPSNLNVVLSTIEEEVKLLQSI
jgi:hypothetical protein